MKMTTKWWKSVLAFAVAVSFAGAGQAAEIKVLTDENKVNPDLFTKKGALKKEVKIDKSIDTQALWNNYCGSCHGKNGVGRTRAGRRAGVKDLTDASYQASFTDQKALVRILEGIKEDGKVQQKPFGPKLREKEIKAIRQCKQRNDCQCPTIEEGQKVLSDKEVKTIRQCVKENRCRCPHEKLTREEMKAMIPFIRGLAK